MDDLLKRADRAIQDSELIRRQVDGNIELARYLHARLLRTLSRRTHEAEIEQEDLQALGGK